MPCDSLPDFFSKKMGNYQIGWYNTEQVESSSEPVKPTTKIIDLSDDCLVKIFDNLDIASLFNVAVANEFLRPAASVVYKRNYAAKSVVFIGIDGEIPRMAHSKANCNAHYRHMIKSSNIKEHGDRNEIAYNLKKCLQFLRCFGFLITNLTIDYAESHSKRYDHLHRYISKYCSKNLIEISFHHKSKYISSPNFNQPFVNVTRVIVICSNLKTQFRAFAKWFPNLYRLELIDVRWKHLAPTFPHLKHLVVKTSPELINSLLHSNTELETLVIKRGCMRVTMDELLSMIKGNSSLTRLDVRNAFAPVLVSSNHIDQLIQGHPALVELNLKRFDFTPANAIALISQHHSLNIFGFHMENYRSDYVKLLTKINSQWMVSENSQPNGQPRFFELKRKTIYVN